MIEIGLRSEWLVVGLMIVLSYILVDGFSGFDSGFLILLPSSHKWFFIRYYLFCRHHVGPVG